MQPNGTNERSANWLTSDDLPNPASPVFLTSVLYGLEPTGQYLSSPLHYRVSNHFRLRTPSAGDTISHSSGPCCCKGNFVDQGTHAATWFKSSGPFCCPVKFPLCMQSQVVELCALHSANSALENRGPNGRTVYQIRSYDGAPLG